MRALNPLLTSLWVAALLVFRPTEGRADPPSYLDHAIVAEVSRRAVSHTGLGTSGSMAARARAAAWLPTVGVSYSMVQGGNVTEAVVDTSDRLVVTDSRVLALHMTLALDRLVFDPREAAIARTELVRSERVLALEALVVELLGNVERARRARADLAPGARPDPEIELTGAIARARLELLIGDSLDTLTRR